MSARLVVADDDETIRALLQAALNAYTVRAAGRLAGVVAFLPKPFDLLELQEAVARALGAPPPAPPWTGWYERSA